MKRDPRNERLAEFDSALWLHEQSRRASDARIKRGLRDAAVALTRQREETETLRRRLAGESQAWTLLARLLVATDALLIVPPLRASARCEARENLAEVARQCRQGMQR